jgi:hypothetical protein
MIVSPADIDADGAINIFDIQVVARSYNSTPQSPNWNEDADVNNDGVIDILDLYMVARDFGEVYV